MTARKRRINLSGRYPIAERYVLKQSLLWLCLLCGMAALRIYAGFLPETNHGATAETVNVASLFALMAIGFICLCKTWGADLYRRHLYYGIDAGRLVLAKGVFIRRRAAFPLAKVTDFYLGQTLTDYVLGTCYLEFATPSEQSARFGRIEGLSRSTGVRLHKQLLRAQTKHRDRPELPRRGIRRRPVKPEAHYSNPRILSPSVNC